MVITVKIVEYAVMKTLVDQGSSTDIYFWGNFPQVASEGKIYDTISRTNTRVKGLIQKGILIFRQHLEEEVQQKRLKSSTWW